MIKNYLERGARGMECALFCETYPALRDRHLDRARSYYPQSLGRWRGTDFILADKYGSGVLKFRNLDDASKYQSAEFAFIAIDELTKNDYQTFNDLRTRLRWPNTPHTPFAAATNPGGIGHSWVKQIWHDKQLPTELQRRFTVKDFNFVSALPSDNPWNTEEYIDSLDTLPEQMRKAYLLGDWNVFAGMFFTQFDVMKHTIEPFVIPPTWRIVASLDPGWASHCSFGIYAIDHEHNIYKVSNYYHRGLTTIQHVEGIYEFIKNGPGSEYTGGRMPDLVISGHDAWARKDRYAILSSEKTMQSCMAEAGIYLTRCITDRVAGWTNLKDALHREKFFLFKELCKPTVEEIASVMSDDKNPEDIQGRGNDPKVPDHALDETRYMLMSTHKAAMPKAEDWNRPSDYLHPRYRKRKGHIISQPLGYEKDWRTL
tara:strand:- start:6773 stop:8056 length:1284 start_codon:yes stop_codon:yes gene_type:complete